MADKATDTPETEPGPSADETGQPATDSVSPDASVTAEAAEIPPPETDAQPEAAPANRGGGFGVVAGTIVAVLLIGGAAAVSWPYWSPRLAALMPAAEGQDDQAGRLASLEDRIASNEAALADVEAATSGGQSLASDLHALGERVAALESSMDTLRQTASEGSDGAGLADLGSRLAALEQAGGATDDLRQRLDVVSAQVEAGESRDAAIAALSERNKELADQVAALGNRIGSVEQARAEAGSAVGARSELLVAISTLRRQISNGMAYADALDAVVQAADGDGEVQAAIAPLTGHAADGIPTRDQLRSSFDDVARAMAQADGAVDGDGWMARTADRLKSLVTVRRVGGGPSGTDVDAAISHAETALAAGDLAAAVGSLEHLAGPAAEAAAPWLEDARSRLAAEQALAALDLRAATLPVAGGK